MERAPGRQTVGHPQWALRAVGVFSDNRRVLTLTPGTVLGSYEVLDPLGAGGMGEVYRARDTRLHREVAIKVLPERFAKDPDALRRFETEARAVAAISHPNILSIFDIGNEGGVSYAVTELLVGDTLRARLVERGAVSARKALEFARQLAEGLAAAHDKGIVHRDLKPENLFLDRDERLKILDFGLAMKASFPARPGGSDQDLPTIRRDTEPGALLGTVGYMSPEQVRGETVDSRSDIFSFGAVLFEMLSGRRAFSRDTSAETLTAILREEPPELSHSESGLFTALERLARRCLDKDPNRRFQSARDLAFALETLHQTGGPISELAGSVADPRPASRRVGSRPGNLLGSRLLLPLALAIGGALGYGAALYRAGSSVERVSYTRLTFRKGWVSSARFGPDGSTVVYGAAWDNEPMRLFSTRVDSIDSTPLEAPSAGLLAISRTGELAIKLGTFSRSGGGPGTLARTSLTGGAPRELLGSVLHADWAPDGGLAVSRRDEKGDFVEFPIGTTIYRAPQGHRLTGLRVSKAGDRLAAVVTRAFLGNLVGRVCMLDRKGQVLAQSAEFVGLVGAAFSEGDREIWFMGTDSGREAPSIRALRKDGQTRIVAASLSDLLLYDIGKGRVLASSYEHRGLIHMGSRSSKEERDLAWLDFSQPADLSDDGQMLLLGESRAGGGVDGSVFLRRTDGSPAVRLGEGEPQSLSRDGRWALSLTRKTPAELVLIPTGAGSSQTIRSATIAFQRARFFPNGRRLLILGREERKEPIFYVLNLAENGAPAGNPRPVTPEGVGGSGTLTPDGRQLLAAVHGVWTFFSIDGGLALPAPALEKTDFPIRFTADGTELFVGRSNPAPTQIFRVNLQNGFRTPWLTLSAEEISRIFLSEDGGIHVYGYQTRQSSLYLIDGLK